MFRIKRSALAAFLIMTLVSINASGQVDIYRSGGGEIIFSGADVQFDNGSAVVDVNTNMRFTLFFHIQQWANFDLNNNFGFLAGGSIRNIGFIVEDYYQNVGFSNIDETDPNWNKNTKIKRRSYALGFPVGFKIGDFDKHYFFYAGGEYEWMFHYKQKLFIDDNKTKFTQWNSPRVTTWNPSLFAGMQFPGGVNLKFRYYLKDFLNTGFRGTDFGRPVDYSEFQSTGIWYISIGIILNNKQIKKIMDSNSFDRVAYR
jgi:hypothetical protein